MKKDKKDKKEKKPVDKGQIFVKITAFILAILMVLSVGGTLIYTLI